MIRYLLAIFLLLFIGCGNDTQPENKPPIARITSETTVQTTKVLTLNANTSSDSDGSIVSYQWIENNKRFSTASEASWVAPNRAGIYTITLRVTDDDGAIDSIDRNITVNEAPNTPFSAIQDLISSRTATYICVGDSTRAGPLSPFDNPPSPYHGEHLFDVLKSALDGYNVSSHLYAKYGQEAKQFNLETRSPTWQDVSDIIPGDGNTTIVDISLGINDLFSEANNYDGTVDDIKTDITSAIGKIKAQKPNTHFLLTMPNPKDPAAFEATQKSNILKTAYLELSSELGLPLIDTMGDINFIHDMFRTDEIHYHMTTSAQEQVANLIKSKILP